MTRALAGTELPAIHQVAFAGSDTVIAEIGDGTITAWSLRTGRERFTLRPRLEGEPHHAAVQVDADDPPNSTTLPDVPWSSALKMTHSPHGDLVLVAAAHRAGCRVELRETRSGSVLHGFDLGDRPGAIPGAVFSRDGTHVALTVGGTTRRTVEVRRTSSWRVETWLQVGWPVAVSPDGSAVVAFSDARLRAWDVASGHALWSSDDELSYAREMWFDPSGALLVTETNHENGAPGRVRIWDARTGRELAALVGDERGPVVSLAFSPDGRLLAVARYWSLEVWDVGAGRLLYRHADRSQTELWVPAHGRCAFSPDGAQIALLTRHGIAVWRVAPRQAR